MNTYPRCLLSHKSSLYTRRCESAGLERIPEWSTNLSGPMWRWINPEIVGPKVFSWSLPIQIRNQFGLCMHVESAAPIPVPVHMRTPRLYRVDVLETPANWNGTCQ
jgi:hypothetical protein